MRDSERYRCGPATSYKQTSFRKALGQCVGISARVRRRGWLLDPFLYVDMNAGPGLCQAVGACCYHAEDDRCADRHGSPLVALRLLTKTEPDNYLALLFDADDDTRASLAAAVQDYPPNRVSIGGESRFLAPVGCTSETRGLVYVDPSNADLPVDTLAEYAASFPKVDILINLACASYKRGVAQDDYERLSDTLGRIGKPRWVVREPRGVHQWAMLYGSNWQPEHPPGKDWRYLDTDEGRQWFERIIYTRAELKNGGQGELF